MSLEVTAALPERHLDLAFRVESGEVVAMLGPNGSGKSTVLALIAGLLRPRAGRVELNGRMLTAVDSGRTAGAWVPPHDRQVALLAQDPLLFPHLSVLDNVAFGPRSRGASRPAAQDSAQRWLTEVDAEQFAARRPTQLSGGQAQRVAVARALAAQPQLLLLDEPMAALDVAVAPALRQTLRRVLHGQTAIIVTHDVLDALLLADRVIILEQGKIVEDGASADVLAQPRSDFAARIAGLNMLRGTWHHDAVVGAAGMHVEGEVVGPLPDDGRPTVAVWRPTAVSVFRQPPGGSPRNKLLVTITNVEPHGDHIRVHAAELSADITAQSAAELDLAPGDEVYFSIKATEVAVYEN